MKQNNLRTVFKEGFLDIFYVWGMEMRSVLKDAGVLIFFVLVPLAYPLVYAFIYTNETVREVPVVAVDASHSSRSREFLRRVDGTADVHIVGYAANLEEAKRINGYPSVRKKDMMSDCRDWARSAPRVQRVMSSARTSFFMVGFVFKLTYEVFKIVRVYFAGFVAKQGALGDRFCHRRFANDKHVVFHHFLPYLGRLLLSLALRRQFVEDAAIDAVHHV